MIQTQARKAVSGDFSSITVPHLLGCTSKLALRAALTGIAPAIVERLLLAYLCARNTRLVAADFLSDPRYAATCNRLSRQFIESYCRSGGILDVRKIRRENGV